jgi:hypothetical protein
MQFLVHAGLDAGRLEHMKEFERLLMKNLPAFKANHALVAARE